MMYVFTVHKNIPSVNLFLELRSLHNAGLRDRANQADGPMVEAMTEANNETHGWVKQVAGPK